MNNYPENDYRFYLHHNDEDMKYGLPDKKKYPMPDRDHVMSAIKFFNYVSPSDEEELARNILKRIREYGIKDINVGETNRFRKYYKPEDDYLSHHGIKGQKWGVRRFQNSDGSLTSAGRERHKYVPKSINDLSSHMKDSISYSEFSKLKSADEVESTGSGSCHDQVMYEIQKLRELGYKPKAQFVIEYDPKTGQGGTTHSFVHFKNGKQTIWFENAWGGEEGIHKYSSLKAIKDDIKNKHKNGEFGDSNKYTKLEFSDFKPDKQKPGSSLQEVVDVALSKDSLSKDIAKGALGGASSKAIDSAVKSVIGKPLSAVGEIAEGAITGAIKAGAKNVIEKRR